jgi:hypothetical protein
MSSDECRRHFASVLDLQQEELLIHDHDSVPQWLVRLCQCLNVVLSISWIHEAFVALGVIFVLLTLQPPFVRLHVHDSRRAGVVTSSLQWSAVFLCALFSLLSVMLYKLWWEV